jgi:crossover junction endodeoxyribonuclease RusA
MIKTILPFPPSVNTYWKKWNNRMVISPRGRQYKKDVTDMLLPYRVTREVDSDAYFHLYVRLFMPDLRKRDPDNYFKSICDAIQESGIIKNDNQIKDHRIRDVGLSRPNGYAEILLIELPTLSANCEKPSISTMLDECYVKYEELIEIK